MELNILEQGLATNRTIFEQSLEQPIDAEFTLPDYCPEIERILKCRVIPRISSKSLNGSSLTADGTAYITLMYVGSDGEISGYDYQFPFSKTVDVGAAGTEPAEAVSVSCECLLDYATCRAITPRRLNVHGSVMLRVKAVCRKACEIIADIDDPCMQTLKGESSATVPVAVTEKQFSVEEEIEIPPDKAAALTVLRCTMDSDASECKVISGKVVVKGRLCVDALYKTEKGCDTIKTELPFSQIVDLPGISEDCAASAKAEICSCELRTKTGMSGEARTFIAGARINLSVEAFCTRDVSLVYDAFSTKYDVDLSKSDISLEKLIHNSSETFLCKKTLEFPEGSFSEIVDVWCDLGGESVKTEDGTVVVSGEIMVCILAKDAGGAAVFFERPAPYDYRFHLDKTPDRMRCSPAIRINGAEYTLMGSGKIEIRAEMKISVAVVEIDAFSVLCGVSLLEDKPKQQSSDTGLVIYFADSGEKVWDIARRYNTSPAEIASVNELTNDTIGNGRMLLIPCV